MNEFHMFRYSVEYVFWNQSIIYLGGSGELVINHGTLNFTYL